MPMILTVLLIDPDDAFAERFRAAARARSWVTAIVRTAAEALEVWRVVKPHVIVCELLLPDMPGIIFLQQLGRVTSRATPVLVCSEQDDPQMRTLALQNGADDAQPKWVSMEELLTRVMVLWTRARRVRVPVHRPMRVTYHNLTLSAANGTATVAAKRIHLTPTEFRLLYLLTERAPDTVSYQDLLYVLSKGSLDDLSDRHLISVHAGRIKGKLRRFSAAPVLKAARSEGYYLAGA